METYDVVIIGGGLFGVYTALLLANKNYQVCLIEKEAAIFSKASTINQARLHEGYHYPRSIATAGLSHEYQHRFLRDHREFINDQFESYYAIDQSSSYTTSAQFDRFCQYIQIAVVRKNQHPLFTMDRIEALYLTHESGFDPVRMAAFYENKLKENNKITLLRSTMIDEATKAQDHWLLELRNSHQAGMKQTIKTAAVINATYAATNSIHKLFGIEPMDLVYELCELVFVKSAPLQNIGLTVIDGPFVSLMPYGLTGKLSLTSVPYTPHQVSYHATPAFDCQHQIPDCLPDQISNCTDCPARPRSHQKKMMLQLKKYLSEVVQINYLHSAYTIKTKLRASYIDDGRPTQIAKHADQPRFYSLFSGKISSIYEIEKIIDHEF